MRHLPLVAALLLSACASAPRPPAPVPRAIVPRAPAAPGADLVGLTAGELIQRFGAPALQVREGAGVKLQFRGPACVLDAFLYPPLQGTGASRVTYSEARLRSGAGVDQRSCIAALQRA